MPELLDFNNWSKAKAYTHERLKTVTGKVKIEETVGAKIVPELHEKLSQIRFKLVFARNALANINFEVAML